MQRDYADSWRLHRLKQGDDFNRYLYLVKITVFAQPEQSENSGDSLLNTPIS